MADANIKINLDSSSLEELNAELVRLQAQIKNIPVGSAEFKKLSAEIRRVDGAAADAGKKLKAIDIGQLAGNVAKVGASVASASALFKQFGADGTESSEQIQSALQATNTILGAAAIAEGVAAAGQVAFAIATEGASIAQGIFAAAVGTSTGALKALKVALITTGVGALVVGLGLLIGYLIDSADETKELAKQQEGLNRAFDKNLEQIDDAIRRKQLQAKIDEAKAIQEKRSLEEIAEIRRKVTQFESDENKRKVREANAAQTRELANFTGTEEEKRKIIDRYDKIRQQSIVTFNNADTQLQLDKIALEEAVAKRTQDIIKERISAEAAFFKTRGELLEVDFAERIKVLDKNQKTELDNVKRAGLSATEIQLRSQEINLRFSFERIKVIQDEENKKLEAVKKGVQARLEIEKKAAEVAGDVGKVQEIQTAITQINEDTNSAIAAANKAALDNLEALKQAGKITGEAYTKALADLSKINTEFKTEITKTITEGGATIISTSVASVLTQFDTALNTSLSLLEIAANEAEVIYLGTIQGKTSKEIEVLEERRKKTRVSNAKTIAQATIDGTEAEIRALEKLTNLTVEEEKKRSDKILQLRVKASKAQLDLATATTEEIVDTTEKETEARVKSIEEFFTELTKYYQQLFQGIQALGFLLADQASLRDLQIEEEIESVNELYDVRFAKIDEEEKRLDALEQAKDNKITATERKRRALAAERAEVEAQQIVELQTLDDARANAQADASIKQAEVNFALATGQIVIATAEAVIKSIAASPVTFGLPFSAFAAASGAIQIAAANSAKQLAISQAEASRPGVSGSASVRVSKAEGGFISGPGNGISDSVPANLSTGEFVVNANATQRFLPLLNQINQSGLQGGNPVNPSGGGSDAMVALLARIEQRLAEPNRAYVVATDIQDIQNKQNYINRRANVL